MRTFDLDIGPLTSRSLRSEWKSSLEQSQRISVTRRSFISGSLAASNLALFSPVAFATPSGEPEFMLSNDQFTVSWGGKSWAINSGSFDGKPCLALRRREGSYQGLLTNAYFASTSLSADLEFSIERKSIGHEFFLKIPALSVEITCSLSEWLSGQAFAAHTHLPLEVSGGEEKTRYRLIGHADGLDHNWTLKFGAQSELKVNRLTHFSDDGQFMSIICRLGLPPPLSLKASKISSHKPDSVQRLNCR